MLSASRLGGGVHRARMARTADGTGLDVLWEPGTSRQVNGDILPVIRSSEWKSPARGGASG